MMHFEFSLIDFNLWPSFLLDYVIHPAIIIILCLLSVFVVLGNIIVVTAIWHENQLHSVTNYLIASLAAADCLVGLVVMPFSIISEIILGSWTFGPTWCDLWHSFDVLASTASIMNLCAISLDRYLAISNPFTYPAKMTPKRVAFLIVSVWTCSSLISFPAILWWHAVGQGPLQELMPSRLPQTETIHQQQQQQLTNNNNLPLSPAQTNSQDLDSLISTQNNKTQTALTTLSPIVLLNDQPFLNDTDISYRCPFTDDTYYLLFSSFVSFYGPLCVMLYAYYKIYTTAVKQTRFLRVGAKQVMVVRGGKKKKRRRYISELSNQGTNEKCGQSDMTSGMSNTDHYDRQHLVLRAHRGGGASTTGSTTGKSSESYSKSEPKRRDVTNNRLEASRLSIDDEDGHKMISAECSNNIENNDDNDKELGQLARVNSSRRIDRINSTLGKKDKLRMDSQRFEKRSTDVEPSSPSTMSLLARHEKVVGTQRAACTIVDFCGSSRDSESDRDCSLNENQRKELNRPKKIVVATMANSRGIDTSVIDKEDIPTSHEVIIIGSPSNSSNHNQDKLIHSRDKLRESNLSSLNSIESSTSRKIDYLANERSIDQGALESSSSSCGSYGTGSISSILVRPQCSAQDSRHETIEVNRNCDTIGNSTLNQYKMRRALSVDDVERRWLGSGKTMIKVVTCNDTRQQNGEQIVCDGSHALTQNSPSKLLNSLEAKDRHRASCSNPLNPNMFTSTKSTIRTLDIRSWVKMARNRSKKSSFSGESPETRTENSTKSPASLMPLMVMNSDTSTDSSIVVVEARKVDTIHEDHNEPDERLTNADSMSSTNKYTNRPASKPNRLLKSGFKKTVSLETGNDREKRKNMFVAANTDKFSLSNNINSKGQLLYYDSDKLIQSIVDLKAIHYIDCANQGSQGHPAGNSSRATRSLTNTSGGASLDANRKSKLNDQIESSKGNLSTPSSTRQRSVGKRLTRIAKEEKAAKTLGIVVGVFILCWLPFFVANIIVALCGMNCIYKPHLLLPIVTWLGWINSAMNPVIYACWSREFRRAFRRVLCTWVEFLCLYDGSKLARKLRLKKGSNYSNHQEVHINRTTSSTKGTTHSVSIATRTGATTLDSGLRSNGNVNRSLLSDEK